MTYQNLNKTIFIVIEIYRGDIKKRFSTSVHHTRVIWGSGPIRGPIHRHRIELPPLHPPRLPATHAAAAAAACPPY